MPNPKPGNPDEWTVTDAEVARVKKGKPTAVKVVVVNQDTGEEYSGHYAWVPEEMWRR